MNPLKAVERAHAHTKHTLCSVLCALPTHWAGQADISAQISDIDFPLDISAVFRTGECDCPTELVHVQAEVCFKYTIGYFFWNNSVCSFSPTEPLVLASLTVLSECNAVD